jgi:hypothetical protein
MLPLPLTLTLLPLTLTLLPLTLTLLPLTLTLTLLPLSSLSLTNSYILDSIATLRYLMMSESSFSGAIKINDGVLYIFLFIYYIFIYLFIIFLFIYLLYFYLFIYYIFIYFIFSCPIIVPARASSLLICI